ncbi:MAG: hypothetical protein ACJ76Y_25880 [Thermoanaerobaculia bacterium]
MRQKIATVLQILVLFSLPVIAQSDPCATPDSRTLRQYFTDLSAKISDDFNKKGADTATAQAKEDTANALASHANGDGVTGGQLDLIRRAFVALNLGQIQEKDGSLVFNFNPETLNLDAGQFSPRVIVNKPTLLTALDQKIDTLSLPDADRQSLKDSLKKDLGDLDDVEAHLRWTQSSGTPRRLLQEIADDIYKDVYRKAAVRPKFQRIGEEDVNNARQALTQMGFSITSTIGEICAKPEAAPVLQDAVKAVEKDGKAALTALHDELTTEQFFALADLIEGEPKLTAEGSFRRRAGAAGPDEGTFSLRYEIGSVSYSGMKRWAHRTGKDLKAVATVQEYLKTRPASTPSFSLTVDYTRTRDFHFALPSAAAFDSPGSHTLTAKLHGGLYLGNTRARRLELDATYDDVTDDPARQDRFVGSVSWIESLNDSLAKVVGGSELVVKLVYANKPKFLGDVDRDLGLRFGLKWSLGGTAVAGQ